MNKQTGGPAFPHGVTERYQDVYGEEHTSEYSQPGMTLRDYFAAQAMQGDWAAQGDKVGNDIDNELLKSRANIYYRIADAMIAERNK